MSTQMYNHLLGLPSNPIGKQVKQEVRNYPYELGDCLIVSNISYLTDWGVSYRVYRLEVYLDTQKVYLDIIVDNQSKFLGLGESYCLAGNWDVSLKICDSLAIQQYMKETF
jgi:hypothetical protein